jgi:phospholipase C
MNDRRARTKSRQVVCVLLLGLGGIGLLATTSAKPVGAATPLAAASGMDKIRHVVVIMQENRSFDSYFGTFPGADGIPMRDGLPTVCSPDPKVGRCVAPYHDAYVVNQGGPHGSADFMADIDGGRMDGFVRQARRALEPRQLRRPRAGFDVMGYHDQRELPNYWTYARDFVLQDHMFSPSQSWSLPEHMYLVSGWSARCARRDDPMSCRDAPSSTELPPDVSNPRVLSYGTRVANPNYAWTDLTWMLHRAHVSWRYYIAVGAEPDCRDPAAVLCPKVHQGPHTGGIWNPLRYFTTVERDGQLKNIQDTSKFLSAARTGHLPSVSWVIPNENVSDHPPSNITAGETHVTNVVNAVMRGPDWGSTAIFLTWDEAGGFYDHVVPPQMDGVSYGLRVPGLLISPYARQGFIDHQTLSFDAYLRFIEDRFLGSERLDPTTDGRPDRRPVVRETVPGLGDLRAEFDFSKPPHPPVILPTRPPTDALHTSAAVARRERGVAYLPDAH